MHANDPSLLVSASGEVFAEDRQQALCRRWRVLWRLRHHHMGESAKTEVRNRCEGKRNRKIAWSTTIRWIPLKALGWAAVPVRHPRVVSRKNISKAIHPPVGNCKHQIQATEKAIQIPYRSLAGRTSIGYTGYTGCLGGKQHYAGLSVCGDP